MKVLYVVVGGAVIDGMRLTPGMKIAEDHRSFKKIVERLKGCVEKYQPGCRAILCDEADLDSALEGLVKPKSVPQRISVGEYKEAQRPILVKEQAKQEEARPEGTKTVISPEGLEVSQPKIQPKVGDSEAVLEDGEKVVAPKRGRPTKS